MKVPSRVRFIGGDSKFAKGRKGFFFLLFFFLFFLFFFFSFFFFSSFSLSFFSPLTWKYSLEGQQAIATPLLKLKDRVLKKKKGEE